MPDVEMKPTDSKPKDGKKDGEKEEKKEAAPPPPPPTPEAEIKANIALIERAVATLEPRFTHRVLRTLATLRKRIDEKVLRNAISEVYAKGA